MTTLPHGEPLYRIHRPGRVVFLFILTVIVAAIGAAIFLKRSVTTRHDDSVSTRPLGGGILGIALIMFAFTIIFIVPTRNIGVTVAFGKPTGTLGNGFHLVAPWESVETYDATIQTLDMSGNDDTPTLSVRIANGATARMNATVNWRIDPSADIQQLHLDWRNFGALQKRVVQSRLQDALNKTFESYDPLIAVKEAGGKPQSLSDMETKVLSRLQDAMPKGMIIDRLQLPMVEYPPALNAYQKELAATQVALQQKVTAAAQREAIDILNGARLSPEAFGQQCLIVTERLAQQGKPISAMWTCVTPSTPAALAFK